MSAEKIRRVQNQQEYEQVINDYLTIGYKIKNRGQGTCYLQKATYGTIQSHILIAIIVCWWTYYIYANTYTYIYWDNLMGNCLINIIVCNLSWFIYNYTSISDSILVKFN